MVYQEQSARFIHTINGQDLISSVNEEWLQFAKDNEAQALIEKPVLNHLIWRYISDPETRILYHQIIAKARKTEQVLSFPYRCDSPRFRRYMRMEVVPHENGQVEFISRIEKREPRPPAPVLDFQRAHSDEFLRICSWCKRIAIAADLWQEVEEAVCELELFHRTTLPQLDHVACPRCFEEIMALVE